MRSFLERRGLLSSIVFSSALGVFASPAVLAQNGNADQGNNTSQPTQQLGTITATGTRIRQADVETAQPVVTIGREQIEHEGYSNAAELLQNLSVAGTPPISRSEVLASGEDVGGYYVDLRNLGAERTLVLINGKRLGTTDSGLQDLEQIPMAAIERIEVLKDGASAVYGSDAIAGVVNIITRKHFNGAEASAYAGQYSDHDDGLKQIYSLTMGASGDKGSITAVAEYSKEDPVWARNRWFSKYGATDRHPDAQLSPATEKGLFFNGNALKYDDLSKHPYGAWCGSDNCTLDKDGNPFNLSDYHPTGLADYSNPNGQMMLKTQLERKSLYVNSDYNITDHLRLKTDILYNHRETVQQVAGYPFQPAFNLPGSSTIIGLTPDSYFNPFGIGPKGNGAGDTLYFYRRGWEVPRTTKSKLETYRIGTTLEGDFDVGPHTWNWDVGAYVNRNDVTKILHGDFSLIAASQALGPSFRDSDTGQVMCGTPDNPTPYGSTPGSCVPWNPMYGLGHEGKGSLSGNPELQKFLFPDYRYTGATQTTDYEANITGSIVTLPAGDLAFALGTEYRREAGRYIPDAMSQAALNTDLSAGPTQGSYNVRSYYAELSVPLLADLPGAQQLSLDLAGRHSRFSSFGKTTNGKYSLSWRPVQELLVRGTYAQGFRAPQIADLFGGTSGDFAYYTDPCGINKDAGNNSDVLKRCTSGFGGQNATPSKFHQLGQGNKPCTDYPCQTPTQFFSGSSPSLQPEKSVTKTAGIVYSPEAVPGQLDLSLDWYHIRINDAIRGDDMDDILYDCYVQGVESRCSSDLFTRDPKSGQVISGHYGERNAGWVETEGWDVGIDYQFPWTAAGVWSISWNTTYMDYLDVKPDNKPDTPVQQSAGWGGNFHVRSNLGIDWSLDNFGVTWTLRYYSPVKEDCSYDDTDQGGPECNMPQIYHNDEVVNANQIGSNTFNDVQVHYNTPIDSTVSVGVNNVFDHFAAPMYSQPNSQYSYYGGFDIGRFYYVRYSQRF
jgi:iron complex outermembrane receptor protein